MYYIITRSTDMRDPRTKVTKTTSERNAIKALTNPENGSYTYGDPELSRNYHRTFTYIFEIQGRIDWKHPQFRDSGSRDYPRTKEDNLYSYLDDFGCRMLECGGKLLPETQVDI